MSKAIAESPTRPLAELAETVNREHAACEAAVRSALKHARKCGEALLAAKDAITHGSFEAWIVLNCKVSPRQARNYMTLAKNWERIIELSNRKRASEMGLEHLSIRAALRLLTQDEGGWKYTNEFCPSCGERLVYTSRFFFTCPACWDCRLYRNPKAASMSGDGGPIQRGKRVREDFRRLSDPFERAEVAVAVLSMLDDAEVVPEVVRLLTEAKQTPTRRRAAEVLERLAGWALEADAE